MPHGSAHLWHFRSRDPDEFGERIAPVAPTVRPCTAGTVPFFTDTTAVRLPRMGIFTISSVGFRVLSPPRKDTVLTIPRRSHFTVRHGRSSIDYHSNKAHVLPPDKPLDLATPARADMLVVILDRDLLEATRSGLADHSTVARVSPTVLMDRPAGISLRRQLGLTWAEVSRGASWLEDDRVVREVEGLLATLVTHVLDERPDEDVPADAGMGAVQRAIDYIHAHLADAVTLADLCAEARVSERSLERAFRQKVDTPPLQYLRQRRLEAAARDLRAADPDVTTVTDVAYRYGFAHLGRFAASYQAAVGELPSQTLQRRAGSGPSPVGLRMRRNGK